MISLIKREDYSSEEEYQEAYKQMLIDIRQHDIDNSEPEYDSSYKENFLGLISESNN